MPRFSVIVVFLSAFRLFGFFDKTPPANVVFDSTSHTWTFSNQRLEGKLFFDTLNNGFFVTSFKDKKNGLDIVNTPSSAGKVCFLTGKRGTPIISRSTNVPKNGAAFSPNPYLYPVDANARIVRLNFEEGAQNKWHTNLVEVQVIVGGVNVAPGKSASALATSIWCGCTPTSAIDDDTATGWTDVNGGSCWWQVDLGSVMHVEEVRIKYAKGTDPTKYDWAPVSISIDVFTVGDNTSLAFDLSSNFALGNWTFGDALSIKGGGVKTLEVEAQGINQNAGTNITLCYDIYPGNEPWVTKWFKISSPQLLADSTAILDSIIFDNFSTASKLAQGSKKQFLSVTPRRSTLHLVPVNSQCTQGLMVSNLNYMWLMDVTAGKVKLGYRPDYWFGEYMQATDNKTTKGFEGFWDGGSFDAGIFQYQVFLVDRHIRTTAKTSKPYVCPYPYGLLRESRLPQVAQLIADMGYNGVFGSDLGDWIKQNYTTSTIPQFCDATDPTSYAYNMVSRGMQTALGISPNTFYPNTGIYINNIPAACSMGQYMGKVSKAAHAATWFIEDKWVDDYHFAAPGGPSGYVDAIWREGFRIISDSIKTAVFPDSITLGRTWENMVEMMDIADWSQPTDHDNYGWADDWMDAYISFIPLQPNFTLCIPSPVFVVNANNPLAHVLVRAGKSAREAIDLDFTASRSANMGIMFNWANDSLTYTTPEEVVIQNKWTTWHVQNAEWLEYTQKLEVNGTLPTGTKGFMHLRDLYQGKYGFVGWWNHSANAATVTARIDTKKWMLTFDTQNLSIKSVRTGNPVAFTVNGDFVELEAIQTPMWSYELLEFSDSTSTGIRQLSDNLQEPFRFDIRPNPFNPTTAITFALSEKQKVLLKVYNLNGQEVACLVNQNMEKGAHHTVWNGRDSFGRELGSGLYLLKLSVPGAQYSRRVMLLK
ncbi:MAG: T9SS type A sorting domain-containing protein [Fibrobacterota bacterium]